MISIRTLLTKTMLKTNKMFYDPKVVEYFENPPNVGSLQKNDPNVGTSTVGSVACGDLLKMQVKVGEDGKIEKAVFKAFGCGSVIASSAYATELLKGMTINEAQQIKNTDISQYLKLPPVKLHCSLLAEEAIQKALSDVQKKRNRKLEIDQQIIFQQKFNKNIFYEQRL